MRLNTKITINKFTFEILVKDIENSIFHMGLFKTFIYAVEEVVVVRIKNFPPV